MSNQKEDVTLSESQTTPFILNVSFLQFLPNEAFLVFPIIKDKKRIIFDGTPSYTRKENKNLAEIHSLLNKTTRKFISKSDILRFLVFNDYNQENTINCIEQYISNKKAILHFPINKPPLNYYTTLNKGCIYVNGKDSFYRPIIIFNWDLLIEEIQCTSKNYIFQVLFYFFHFVIEMLLLPGQIEQWNIILDSNHKNLNYSDDFKYIMFLLIDSFPKRLNLIFILNCDSINGYMWKLLKLALENKTQTNNIVHILDSEKSLLFSYINPVQIEQKYGGKGINKEKDFFPPYINLHLDSNDYHTEGIIPPLISEEEYKIKMRNDYKYFKVNPELFDVHFEIFGIKRKGTMKVSTEGNDQTKVNSNISTCKTSKIESTSQEEKEEKEGKIKEGEIKSIIPTNNIKQEIIYDEYTVNDNNSICNFFYCSKNYKNNIIKQKSNVCILF